MTDRRKFLQLIASACAVAACPKILIPEGATIEPVHVSCSYVGVTFSGNVSLSRYLGFLYAEAEAMSTINTYSRGAVPTRTPWSSRADSNR